MKHTASLAAFVLLSGCYADGSATPEYLRDQQLTRARNRAASNIAALASEATPVGECTLTSGGGSVVAMQLAVASLCGVREADGLSCDDGEQSATLLFNPEAGAAANQRGAGLNFLRPTLLDGDCTPPYYVFTGGPGTRPGIVSMEEIVDAVRSVPLEGVAPVTYDDFWRPEGDEQ